MNCSRCTFINGEHDTYCAICNSILKRKRSFEGTFEDDDTTTFPDRKKIRTKKQTPTQNKKLKEIACHGCTFINQFGTINCSICQTKLEDDDVEDKTLTLTDETVACSSCPTCSALNSSSPTKCEICETKIEEISKFDEISLSAGDQTNESKMDALLLSQQEDTSLNVEGILEQLKILIVQKQKVLEENEHKNNFYNFHLTDKVPHYSQKNVYGSHWSCGYRNLQMLCGYLINFSDDFSRVLFGGTGVIPDILAIQQWMELAWEGGFDPIGRSHFNGHLYGKNEWIGATDCVALLRFFSLRAEVIDFNFSQKSPKSTKNKNKNANIQLGNEGLFDWIWEYFSNHQNGFCPPLFLQHDGHSRTIVGVESKQQGNKSIKNVFVFDPISQGTDIMRAVENTKGWERFLKRGIHTFKRKQYQIVFVRLGLMSKNERDNSKEISSQLIF